MYDQFNRRINYLRISLTDRCNLRCSYCVPAEGVSLMPKKDILSHEEIVEVVKVGATLGINKIRLTGGEPLMCDNIVELTAQIKSIKGIDEVGMTTNGTRLSKYAKPLKEAGLDRVNVSLDTLDTVKFTRITKGSLTDVLEGIEAAVEVGLSPVKINFVRMKGVNEEDEQEVKNFCTAKGLQIRFIRQMHLETGEFYPVEGGEGGICSLCNRLRLTANGTIKPCLHSDFGFNIRDYGIEQAYMNALRMKPEKGIGSKTHQFYNIGG